MGCAASGVNAVTKPLPDQELFYKRYDVGETIGNGTFGKVCKASRKGSPAEVTVSRDHSASDLWASNKSSNTELAVKILTLHKDANSEYRSMAERQVKREAQIWKSIGQHPHIVHLNGLYMDSLAPRLAFVVMERCGQDLSTCLTGLAKDDFRFASIFRCVLSALEHMHSRDIVHRDLKPANILLSLDDDHVAKLCDFGVAACLPKSGFLQDVVGSAPYMAPELVRADKYATGVDVWSCGICIYLGLYDSFPYEAASSASSDFKAAILKGNPASFKPRRRSVSVSPVATAFAKWLLEREPDKRPTATEALETPFFNQDQLQADARFSSMEHSKWEQVTTASCSRASSRKTTRDSSEFTSVRTSSQ
jgi:serine/threonine protein kinase